MGAFNSCNAGSRARIDVTMPPTARSAGARRARDTRGGGALSERTCARTTESEIERERGRQRAREGTASRNIRPASMKADSSILGTDLCGHKGAQTDRSAHTCARGHVGDASQKTGRARTPASAISACAHARSAISSCAHARKLRCHAPQRLPRPEAHAARATAQQLMQLVRTPRHPEVLAANAARHTGGVCVCMQTPANPAAPPPAARLARLQRATHPEQ